MCFRGLPLACVMPSAKPWIATPRPTRLQTLRVRQFWKTSRTSQANLNLPVVKTRGSYVKLNSSSVCRAVSVLRDHR